ncbi:hypothetical protein Y695_02338 [Hydrogenophaga sp. T4]|nr:hypothetical protein Y695_02338 [Hydrogenophaga sp. T4]
MPSACAQPNKCSRAAIASFAVAMVLSRYLGMFAANSANQLSLCQLGLGLTSSGASALSIHLMPLSSVDGWVQVSALEAESWPPLAWLVSMPA